MFSTLTTYFRKRRVLKRVPSLRDWEYLSWGDLHPELQEDYNFVREIVHVLNNPLHALEDLPLLREDYQVWRNVFEGKRFRHCAIYESILDAVHPRLLADRALIRKACACFGAGIVTKKMDLSLLADNLFFVELIENDENDENIENNGNGYDSLLSPGFHRAVDDYETNSDTTTRALCCRIVKNCFPLAMKALETKSTTTFMANQLHIWGSCLLRAGMFFRRDVVTAWFESGLWIDESNFGCYPPVWDKDKEFFLLIAEHCCALYKRSSFRRCSRKLRCDKPFMVKVLEKDASLFFDFCERELWADDDVATLAIASSCQTLVQRQYSRTPKFMEQLQGRLEAKIQEEKNFKHVLSWGAYQGCHLDAFMKRIVGEYCDSIAPEKLQMIQQASHKILECVRLTRLMRKRTKKGPPSSAGNTLGGFPVASRAKLSALTASAAEQRWSAQQPLINGEFH